jgi:hypothetical protein
VFLIAAAAKWNEHVIRKCNLAVRRHREVGENEGKFEVSSFQFSVRVNGVANRHVPLI